MRKINNFIDVEYEVVSTGKVEGINLMNDFKKCISKLMKCATWFLMAVIGMFGLIFVLGLISGIYQIIMGI